MDVEPRTIPEFLTLAVSRRGGEPALGSIRHGVPKWFTWQQVAAEVAQVGELLRSAGVQSGDRVAHVSENRHEWIITDLAIHFAGGVHVPLHVTLSGQQIAEQISDCGARAVFVSSGKQLAKFGELLAPNVRIFLHDEQDGGSDKALLNKPEFAPGSDSQSPASDDLATILYTSGTTGRPRGVMLTQQNLATNAAAIANALGASSSDIRLGVLPLSHIFARTCDLYTWLYCGSQLVLAECRETLARDFQLVRPTVFNAVPYVYQKIVAAIQSAESRDTSASLQSFFGGRIENLCCGGAPLALEIETWYRERGLPILPGYGMTEASPVISASTPSAHRTGSVGQLLSGVIAKVAADGELLVRGPNVMTGYWQDEAATAAAIRDGWLHTGDLAEIDADGYLFIRGRKKELIVLSTGKKVSPSRVEMLLTSSPLIEQAAVFGDGQPGLIALIFPTPGNGPTTDDIATEIARSLSCAAHEEQIRAFAASSVRFLSTEAN